MYYGARRKAPGSWFVPLQIQCLRSLSTTDLRVTTTTLVLQKQTWITFQDQEQIRK